jgi:hypothetical protein
VKYEMTSGDMALFYSVMYPIGNVIVMYCDNQIPIS